MPYTADPFVWDHKLRVGDTYQPMAVVFLDPDGMPYDLTGVTGECQILSELGGEVLLEPTVVVSDPTGGTITWSAPAAETTALVPGDSYPFGVRLTWPGAAPQHVKTVVIGSITVLPAVLRG